MSQSRIPKVVYAYFKSYVSGWDPLDVAGHPMIKQVFTPGKGWKNYSGNKRVSVSWLRKLRAEGVTMVALAAPSHPKRIVDFSIAEVCRGESKTYPCGICA